MNPRTVGIFAGAAAVCVAAFFLVVRGQVEVPIPPSRPDPQTPFHANPSEQPVSDVSFGDTVQAHAVLSQSHVLSQAQSEIYLNVELSSHATQTSRQTFSAVLAIDRSGSMAGVKIDNAREAALSFLARMHDDDSISIVSYGSDVTTDLALSRVGDVRGRAQRVIAGIDAGGGTNISGGMQASLRQLAQANGARRVVLISDGRPTEGIRSAQSLAAIAADAREQRVSFSALGIGLDYDENVMEAIALKGGGGFYHLKRADAMAQILRQEFQAIESIVASGLRLQLDPGAYVRIEEVYGYDFSKQGNGVTINVGDISADAKLRVVARATIFASPNPLNRFASLAMSYRLPAQGVGESAAAALSYATSQDLAKVEKTQVTDILAAAHRIEAAAAVRTSMEQFNQGQRGGAEETLRRAQKRLRSAASQMPAEYAEPLMLQAQSVGEMGQEVNSVAEGSDRAKGFMKANRAASFDMQRK